MHRGRGGGRRACPVERQPYLPGRHFRQAPPEQALRFHPAARGGGGHRDLPRGLQRPHLLQPGPQGIRPGGVRYGGQLRPPGPRLRHGRGDDPLHHPQACGGSPLRQILRLRHDYPPWGPRLAHASVHASLFQYPDGRMGRHLREAHALPSGRHRRGPGGGGAQLPHRDPHQRLRMLRGRLRYGLRHPHRGGPGREGGPDPRLRREP